MPATNASLPLDPTQTARAAGLRYVSDDLPGIRRRTRGGRFGYADAAGKAIRDPAVLQRIAKLAIPPAWTDVWICPQPSGHLQATGRDARGRKQYRYHPEWRTARDVTKFGRMIAFGEALPRLRDRADQDLSRPGLPREKVLAAVVQLLEMTLIRIGNREYAKQNNSFGLTTLRGHHVEIRGSRVCFGFRGKSGQDHSIEISDRRLARVVKQCRELPGQLLFQYLDDDGVRQAITSDDVNAYVRETTGDDFTAKDFRTWGGTGLALEAFLEIGALDSERQGAQAVVQVVKQVAAELGNRPATCRKYYIHPLVIDTFLSGRLDAAVAATPKPRKLDSADNGLPSRDARVLQLLRSASD